MLWSVFYIFLLYVVIGLLWAGAEKVFYGERTPRVIDDVVAIILAVTLYLLIKTWMS